MNEKIEELWREVRELSLGSNRTIERLESPPTLQFQDILYANKVTVFPSPENLEDEISKFPLYFNDPSPFECTVKNGEILYLYDSLLFLGIFYDIQFNIKYAYFNFLQPIDYGSPMSPMMPEKLCEEIDFDPDFDLIKIIRILLIYDNLLILILYCVHDTKLAFKQMQNTYFHYRSIVVIEYLLLQYLN
ncbi:transmembrane protein, putative [Medicago truncatula]|uniref:Transmembrane protein, putative n=1 Tax=Medicago truncatula TaxID=3880 RepID=G7JXN4_MEDTR|nr:transmembrane protein, putative [Medicago truncatula]